MENTTFIALSRQMALRHQLDVLAHNVANMATPGFKTEKVMFTDYLMDTNDPVTSDNDPVHMVLDYGTYRDTAQGELIHTGNPLDLALDGNGYFTVEGRNGMRYTRAGRLELSADMQLIDRNGLLILDDGGQPIDIPADARDIRIASDGTISTVVGDIAKLGIVRFDREQFVRPLGGGLHETNEPPLPAENTRIIQGMVEKSNVQPIVEMTTMINVQRAYQANQRLLETNNDLQRNAIQKISQLN